MNSKLIKSGLLTLCVKALGVTLFFLMNVLLARKLGVEQYGIYSFAISIVMVFAIPAYGGAPVLVLRETASLMTTEKAFGQSIGYLWLWCIKIVCFLSVMSVSLFCLSLYFGLQEKLRLDFASLVYLSSLIPLVAFMMMNAAMLRGMRRMIVGVIPEQVLLSLGIMFLMCLYIGDTFKASDIIRFHCISLGLGVVFTLFFLIKNGVYVSLKKGMGDYNKMRSSMLSLTFLTGLQVANKYTSILVVGFMLTPEDTGVYRVAMQVSVIAAFGLNIVNTFIAPNIVSLFKANKTDELKQLIEVSSRLLLCFSICVFLVMIFFGDIFIVWAFGKEFLAGSQVLYVLLVGQIVNCLFGPVGLLLNMTGNEKVTLRITVYVFLVSIPASIALVYYFGVLGASVALALTLIAWNVAAWKKTINLVSINTLPFSR